MITSRLQSKLEQSLSAGLDQQQGGGGGGGDAEELLGRVLQTYSSISRQEAAESMFQSQVVRPYLDEVSQTVTTINFIPDYLNFILPIYR